jgi:hypothetical protein
MYKLNKLMSTYIFSDNTKSINWVDWGNMSTIREKWPNSGNTITTYTKMCHLFSYEVYYVIDALKLVQTEYFFH